MSMKTHYTYVTFHEPTGRYYIGVRSCVGDPNDDPYMGSGRELIKAMKAAPEGWVKHIHKTYLTRAEALSDEGLMTDGHYGNEWCLNRTRGGKSWQICTREGYTHTKETRQKISEKAKARPNVCVAATQAAAAANRGRKQDPAHTATIKEKLTAFYSLPENAQKLAERNPMKNSVSRAKLAESKRGLKHCHNPVTGERKSLRVMPIGWLEGWPGWAPGRKKA